jgi:hypothetical protein
LREGDLVVARRVDRPGELLGVEWLGLEEVKRWVADVVGQQRERREGWGVVQRKAAELAELAAAEGEWEVAGSLLLVMGLRSRGQPAVGLESLALASMVLVSEEADGWR